uniref:Uncharacterized protein n=1 Tax=Heliothis virescens TaxID=7102 RepID=A0A2A4J1Y8_HELVI
MSSKGNVSNKKQVSAALGQAPTSSQTGQMQRPSARPAQVRKAQRPALFDKSPVDDTAATAPPTHSLPTIPTASVLARVASLESLSQEKTAESLPVTSERVSPHSGEIVSLSPVDQEVVPTRQSMLPPTSMKRQGVFMDQATRVANEIFLQGKEALEQAGNMKRECKQTAMECLQSLFQNCLALSESRGRHIASLERERALHARELLNTEKAHARQIAEMHSKLLTDLQKAKEDVKSNLEETKAVRSWLGYETDIPHRQIELIATTVKKLETQIQAIAASTRPETQTASLELGPLAIDHKAMIQKLNNISQQTDELRRCIERISGMGERILSTAEKAVTQIEDLERQASLTRNTSEVGLGKKMEDVMESIKVLKQSIENQTPLPLTDKNPIEDHLQPIAERLEMVSEEMVSELRTIKELKKDTTAPPAVGLGAELALAEITKVRLG